MPAGARMCPKRRRLTLQPTRHPIGNGAMTRIVRIGAAAPGIDPLRFGHPGRNFSRPGLMAVAQGGRCAIAAHPMRRRAGSAAHVRDTTVLCLTIGLTIAVESFSSVSAASAALIPPRHPRLCAPEPLATGAGGPAVPGGRVLREVEHCIQALEMACWRGFSAVHLSCPFRAPSAGAAIDSGSPPREPGRREWAVGGVRMCPARPQESGIRRAHRIVAPSAPATGVWADRGALQPGAADYAWADTAS